MTTIVSPVDSPHASAAPRSVRERLVPPMPHPTWAGWLGPALLAALAATLRFLRLGRPGQIYFDETYYAKDAFALRTFGVEHETVDNADELLAQGQRDIWTGGADFVVHPPLGKWMIAAGDHLWGLIPFGTSMSPTGWRIAAAVVGALSVFLLARLAIRMTRSVLLGCAAGMIMALDGLHFTMSRIAMVDMFLTFWILAGFACLVVDRDRARARLADRTEYGDVAGWLGVRWWRIAAGVCFGLACGSKWSAVFFVAAFGLLTVAWDYGARRTVGQHRAAARWFVFDAVPAFVSIVGVAAVTYVATWSGWLFSGSGWGRDWADSHPPEGPLGALIPESLYGAVAPLRSLWHYHAEILNFHTGLSSHHDYASQPWEWPLMRTPVAFYYSNEETGCGAADCSTAILNIGSPVVWWSAIVAMAVMLVWWAIYRDWRAGAVLVGAAAGWLPWFAYPDRTMFVFYALPMLPFLVLAIVLGLGLLLGPDLDSPRFSQLRRVIGGVAFGVVLLLVIANFAYLYPVLSAQTIPYEDWANRMWFDTWIYGNASS